jgi:superfamily II DNA/RNA helicase
MDCFGTKIDYDVQILTFAVSDHRREYWSGEMTKLCAWVFLVILWEVAHAPFSLGLAFDSRPPRGGKTSSREFPRSSSSSSSKKNSDENKDNKNNNVSSQQRQPQWKGPKQGRSDKTSRNTSGYALRAAGIKSTGSKRTPRWEQEGDALYREVQSSSAAGGSYKQPTATSKASINVEEAETILAQLATLGQESQTKTTKISKAADKKKAAETENDENKPKAGIVKSTNNHQDNKDITPDRNSPPPPDTMWGTLPVGPVLKSRLLQASFNTPTPVQTAAFAVLTSRQRDNAVLASPTGSGKSLAYLLPLLSSSARSSCEIIIVTPTVELAMQLQREVDSLWPVQLSKDKVDTASNGDLAKSIMHVVGVNRKHPAPTDLTDDSDLERIVPHIPEGSTILAGTPRTLRTLLAEVSDKPSSVISQSLCSNLRVVVLDEADRLLNTEAVARAAMELAQRREDDASSSARSAGKPKQRSPSKPLARRLSTTQTELFLSELPIRSLQDIQLVCASATVGRTLRRQLMELLQTPSIDKAAVLVTGEGDERTKKDATRRKASLVPATLTHQYHVLPPSKASKETTTDEGAQQEEVMVAMWQVMQSLDTPAPLLVFPGRVGIEKVQQYLHEQNCSNIRTLASSSGDLWSSSVESSVEVEEVRSTIGRLPSWSNMPIYVVPERFGRGLDLPGVRYVLLLSPPSSAAGYAHLSGRTGRNGNLGTAITFVRPREATKLVAIATALGLPFERSATRRDVPEIRNYAPAKGEERDSDSPLQLEETATIDHNRAVDERENVTVVGAALIVGSSPTATWAQLSESALQRKTVLQLTEYLEKNVRERLCVLVLIKLSPVFKFFFWLSLGNLTFCVFLAV